MILKNFMRGVFVVAWLSTFQALGQTPQQIGYQGRLLKADGTPENGRVSIGFALFTEESGGTSIWSETQDVVPVDGFYSVLLGRSTPFPAATFKGSLWLELTVGGATLAPRNPVASVPFAMTAANAQSLTGGSVSATTVSASNGLTCSGPARFSGPGVAPVAGNISGPATTITGTGTHFLTELAPGDALVVGSESRLVVAIQSDTQLTIDSPFLTAPNLSAFSHQPATLRVDDSKGNPQLVVNAQGTVGVLGSLGVGTLSPRQALEVKGHARIASPNTRDITGLEFQRIDEDNREHIWKLWNMNAVYGKNELQVWEYRNDSAGKSCGGNPADGAACSSRLTIAPWGNVSIPNQSSVLAANVASFASPNITFTRVPYGNVSYDRQGEFDTANSRFVASAAGNYLVCASLSGNANNFWFELDFFVNGSRLRGFAVGTAGTVSGCGAVHLNAKDHLEIWTWQNSGSTQTYGPNPLWSYLTIDKIS